MRCARLAPALLLHVNLLLAAYAGVGLATCARLAWDASAYVPLREVLPHDGRALTAALLAVALVLLLLTHLAALAPRAAHAARPLLVTYAALSGALVCGEAAWCWWAAVRVRAWLASQRARDLLELRAALEPALHALARLHPLPDTLRGAFEEAQADALRLARVALAAVALLAALQLSAVALALIAARALRVRRISDGGECGDTDGCEGKVTRAKEKAPLMQTAWRRNLHQSDVVGS